MVVSQGCDLVKDRFPWATVVPVWDASEILSDAQLGAARAGKTWHFVHLTADWAAGTWLADLRLEIPVDKMILAERQPVEGFRDEVGYGRLAERLAASRQRPAVPQPGIDHVIKPLSGLLSDRRKAGLDLLEGVRELRVQSNDPVAPTTVHVFVIMNDGASTNQEGWDELFVHLHQEAAGAGIALGGPDILTLWDMSAADYITSHAVEAADSS